jgi:hypothetical protein
METGQLTVNGYRVNAMPCNIRRSASLDYLDNLHANAAPEDLRQQYALKNPHRPIPYHPKQCCHNLLKLCSYATRNDCLDQYLHVIDVYVADLKKHSINHLSALYVAFPFDYEEYDRTFKAPWYSGLSQGFLLGV